MGNLCGCGGREWLGWRVRVCLVVGRFFVGGGATVFGLVFGDTAGGGENEGSNLCPACG